MAAVKKVVVLDYGSGNLRSAERALARVGADVEVTSLARHFNRQEVKAPAPSPADDAVVARGKQVAGSNHCGQCHLPTYRGRDQMPRLAGQREDYLVTEMIAYRDGKRTGADTTMAGVLHGMSDADIKAVGAFLARLPP